MLTAALVGMSLVLTGPEVLGQARIAWGSFAEGGEWLDSFLALDTSAERRSGGSSGGESARGHGDGRRGFTMIEWPRP